MPSRVFHSRNPYVERLIGTLRRDCLDHVLVFGERHLRQILALYSSYYNETRTHLGLGKDAPVCTENLIRIDCVTATGPKRCWRRPPGVRSFASACRPYDPASPTFPCQSAPCRAAHKLATQHLDASAAELRAIRLS